MSCQFHSPPLYPRGKSPRYPAVKRTAGPHSQSGCYGENRNPWHCVVFRSILLPPSSGLKRKALGKVEQIYARYKRWYSPAANRKREGILVTALRGKRWGIQERVATGTHMPARSLVLTDSERAWMAVDKEARWCTGWIATVRKCQSSPIGKQLPCQSFIKAN